MTSSKKWHEMAVWIRFALAFRARMEEPKASLEVPSPAPVKVKEPLESV